MKCTTASKINKGENSKQVKKFGAKVIASSSSSIVNSRNLSVKTTTPTNAELEKADVFSKSASYIFTNNSPTSIEGLLDLGLLEDDNAKKMLEQSGANLYKDIALDYFSRNKGSMLSPTPNNTIQVILEKYSNEAVQNTDTRSFIKLTYADIAAAKKVVDTEFLSADENREELDKAQLYKEGMEFLLISALYRGFDVSIDNAFSNEVVQSAIKRYNKHLKAAGKKVVFASAFRSGENITRISSVETYLEDLSAPVKVKTDPVTSIDSNNLFLNAMLEDSERETFELYKAPNLMSRLVVANRVINIFKDMMPNLDAQILSTQEIKMRFGPSFSRKKGFIIAGKIILNQERFDTSTLFHEFGHYYSRWLAEYKPEAHSNLMEVVQNNYSDDIDGYSTLYKSTGLAHNNTDILEEIFVDKLGMIAARKLEESIGAVDPENSDEIARTVDEFTQDFLRKMTKDRSIKLLSTELTLDSTIADIFNIGMMYSTSLNRTSLAVFDRLHMRSFKDFFIQKASAKDIYQGLVQKGMIRGVHGDKIALYDDMGNRLNIKGELDSTATYEFKPWDSYDNVKSNNAFLDEARDYLDKYKNFASVKFSVAQKPEEVIAIIKRATGGLDLTEDSKNYMKDGVVLDRVTHYLQEQFGAKADSEMFILNTMYSEKLKALTAASEKAGEEKTVEVSNRLFEEVKEYMENDTKSAFKTAYKNTADKFAFKTNEGTYLHAIAETYMRALNYSLNIDYGPQAKEDRGLMHFSKHIAEGIAAETTEKFDDYFEKRFFSHLRGQENTPEFIPFTENIVYLRKAMAQRGISRDAARDFIRLLNADVIPVLNKLKGPITIMTEVKLSSVTLGVAGTIDLLVIDGDGRAHIFDYKTKEEGKREFWDWKGGTNMKGTMGSYKENAMMKASIQTSIYKLMLKELGIDTGKSSVFYVESNMGSYTEAELENLNSLRYKPKRITKEGLHDVSAELMEHFIANNRTPKISFNTSAATDIKNFVIQASGDYDIDLMEDIEQEARAIYDRALVKKLGRNGDRKFNYLIDLVSRRQGTAGETPEVVGLTVELPGRVKRTLDPKYVTEAERIGAIADALRAKESVRSLGSSLDVLFNGQDRYTTLHGAQLSSFDKEAGLRALIRGTDSISHELVKLSSNADYGNEFSNIEILRNKTTGENRLIIINHDDDSQLKFGGGRERNNIFGKYLSNNGAKIASPTVEWFNTTHNMRLIKAGLVMLNQKQVDPSFTVSIVVSNPGFSKLSHVPNLHDVATILSMTKKMIEVMRDSGETVPESILKKLDKPELFESRSYVKNPIESLSSYLEMASGDYLRMEDMFQKGNAKKNKAALKDLLSGYDPNQDNHKLIDALHDFRNSMRSKLVDTQARVNSDLWTLTDHVIMHLMGFNYTISPRNTTFMNNFLVTTSKMSNKYGASFNRKIQESAVNIRTDFMVYKNEHNKLIQELAKANGVDIGNTSSALYKSSMKEIYKNLYTTDNTKRGTAFILKDPSQVSKKAERDYLIYLRKTFQKFSDMSSYSDVVIPFGWMPIIRKSKASTAKDTDIIESTREKLSIFNKDSAMKDKENLRPIDEEFDLESVFSDQLPKKNSIPEEQYTFGRRVKLSVNEFGEETPSANDNPISSIEDNLENVMDAFAVSALDTFHYKDVSEFGRSLFYTIKRHEALGKVELNAVIDTVSLIQRRVVKHKESDGNNKLIKGLDSFATTASVAGTVSQALLETFTNPLVTAANYLGDKLYGTLFKGTREFSAKSYAEAFKLVALPSGKDKDIIEAIQKTYGIVTSDTASLKEMMNLLESKSIFQSKHLMFVNKIMLESWQKISMVAYMLEQGSYRAHSIDADGNLVYDEKKDKRFHFANKGASDAVYRDKQKFYEATKREMAKQRNGLLQDPSVEYDKRALSKAWTTFDANHVKEMIVEMYSSLDDTSKSLATYYTYMGFLAKMKTWLFSKTPRYFQKTMTAEENESASRLVKVMDDTAEDGYRYEWKGTPTEGILFTLAHMGRQLAEHRSQVFKNGTLNEYQKMNMSKLLADVLMFSILGAAATGLFKYALDDETRENEVVKLVYQRWIMATSDVFVLKSITDMTTGNGSMMIGVSIGARFVKSVVNTAIIAPQVLYDPDTSLDDLKEAGLKLGRSAYGPFKTGELIVNTLSKD